MFSGGTLFPPGNLQRRKASTLVASVDNTDLGRWKKYALNW
jgi:hypothetical protein